ncbi:MAG: ribosome maturation factor RimM [bacterium]|nr:ribosome maturation factor RimM [bacterium]
MKKQFLEIGRIVGTHGIRGEVRVQPWSDEPEFLKQFKSFYLDGKGEEAINVVSVRPHKNIVIIKFSGIDTIESAEKYRNRIIFINRRDAKIEKGRYFIQDLIGCRVYHIDNGNLLGEISDVSQTGANDVWHIFDGKEEYLIPSIPEVVISVNIEQEEIKIRPIKGIFKDED